MKTFFRVLLLFFVLTSGAFSSCKHVGEGDSIGDDAEFYRNNSDDEETEGDDHPSEAPQKESYALGTVVFKAEGTTYTIHEFALDSTTVLAWNTPKVDNPGVVAVLQSADLGNRITIRLKGMDTSQERLSGTGALTTNQLITVELGDWYYRFTEGDLNLASCSRVSGTLNLELSGTCNRTETIADAALEENIPAELQIAVRIPQVLVDGEAVASTTNPQ